MNHQTKKMFQQILRINQAGEVGADAIYKGQLLTLSKHTSHIKPTVQHMHDQEIKHLDYFNRGVSENRVRPSLLLPLWTAAGYTLGISFASSLEL